MFAVLGGRLRFQGEMARVAHLNVRVFEEHGREAAAHLRDAEQKLNSEIERAFQHYAFLIRTDEAVIEWKRFDAEIRRLSKGRTYGVSSLKDVAISL